MECKTNARRLRLSLFGDARQTGCLQGCVTGRAYGERGELRGGWRDGSTGPTLKSVAEGSRLGVWWGRSRGSTICRSPLQQHSPFLPPSHQSHSSLLPHLTHLVYHTLLRPHSPIHTIQHNTDKMVKAGTATPHALTHEHNTLTNTPEQSLPAPLAVLVR